MGSVRANRNDRLFLDFRFRGKRFREHVSLPDTPANRRKLEKLMTRIESEIKLGKFDYAKHFPESPNLAKLDLSDEPAAQQIGPARSKPPSSAGPPADDGREELRALGAKVGAVQATPGDGPADAPLFRDYAWEWFAMMEVNWRKSHLTNVRGIINQYLLPTFGHVRVDCITRADLLKFRSLLAKVPGRNSSTLSSKRINTIMDPLRQILDEAADQFNFITPYRRIKPLKVKRSDVEPFSLAEVQQIIRHVRADFRNYYIVRFFTGMRTGEIDGLKWKYVDFDRRLILIRETIVAGRAEDDAKTEQSLRDIQMSDMVYQALRAQYEATGNLSLHVFCNLKGQPLDHNNVTKRVWYPLLASLGFARRRPYQTRHTAATLWLAAGEAPEWIARQMGHATTQMLFRVYSRYVPNLTRRDGSALETLVRRAMGQELGLSSPDRAEAGRVLAKEEAGS